LDSNGSAIASDPELRPLADELLREFKDSPVCRSDPLAGSELRAAREALFGAGAEQREDAAHAWQSLRKLGNEAIKAGLIWPAEAAYRLALEEGASVVPATEASVIDSNRALALLKAGHHLEASVAAERALEKDPRNAKAAFRRAQALLDLPGAGAKELRAAEEAAAIAARLEPKDTKVAETLSRARKLLEAMSSSDDKAEGYPDAEADGPAEALDEMD